MTKAQHRAELQRSVAGKIDLKHWDSFIIYKREQPPEDYLVKSLPAMRETWIQSLGWKDPLEKGKATHSNILAWRIPWTVVHGGRKESDTTEGLSLHF